MLDETTGNDPEMVLFLQHLCGYLLTGSTLEQILVFIYGSGGNGKSVFMNVVSKMLGDYSVTAPTETFATTKNEQHPTGIARLDGARVVCVPAKRNEAGACPRRGSKT